MSLVYEDLKQKIKSLNETVWEKRAAWPDVQDWLKNFAEDPSAGPSERLHALHLLAQFMYFGSQEMRELLKALYRDHFKYPLVERIRKENGDTKDVAFVRTRFDQLLETTRFLGVGNPSESGTHLLYYFRQENVLPKKLFIHTHQIFSRESSSRVLTVRNAAIERYVFIDDLCGSGKQARDYSTDILEDLKRLNPRAWVGYFVLFGTSEGLADVRGRTRFDEVRCVFELDATFKCFGADSRYFTAGDGFDKDFARNTSARHGAKLFPAHPLGYRDSQLLIGFHHNVPDNTLPIIWGDTEWRPIFRRYPKLYGWPS